MGSHSSTLRLAYFSTCGFKMVQYSGKSFQNRLSHNPDFCHNMKHYIVYPQKKPIRQICAYTIRDNTDKKSVPNVLVTFTKMHERSRCLLVYVLPYMQPRYTFNVNVMPIVRLSASIRIDLPVSRISSRNNQRKLVCPYRNSLGIYAYCPCTRTCHRPP